MKNKLLSLALSLVFVLSLCSAFTCSAQSADFVERAQSIVDGVLSYKLDEAGVANTRELLCGSLAENAGTSEWYVLSLIQCGERDTSSYLAALENYLTDAPAMSAQSRQKYALLLLASGAEDSAYITDVMESTVGENGLMSFVFALHLMNNGCESSRYSVSEVINKLLSLQLEDGGWTVIGSVGDVDATAMTLQALTPYADDGEISAAVDSGILFLSERQCSDGGYASFGAENPESSAQVLCALSGLGIDAADDSRFIKNGNTVFDALESFRLPNGSFSHTADGASSDSATVQSLYAAISYIRMTEGKDGFFILDKDDNDDIASSLGEETDPADTKDEYADEVQRAHVPLKGYIALAVIIVAAAIIAVLAAVSRLGKKALAAVLAATVIVLGVLVVVDIKLPSEYYGTYDNKTESVGTVSVAILCDTLTGRAEESHIPTDGVILGSTTFSLGEGDSAYDMLVAAARQYGITIDVSGTGGAYVRGIAGIYEHDFGELSGWMYFVNGTAPSVSAAEYIPTDGDAIEWRYTCELGRDLE